MSPTKRPVRRRRPPLGRRLLAFWLPLVAGTIAVAAAVWFAVGWPGFAPSQIDVTGNSAVPSATIVAHAGILRGVNLWLQNPRAMARRVEAIADIETARVYRLPPSRILISVRERVPFAILTDGFQDVVIDRNLRVLDVSPAGRQLPRFIVASAQFAPGRFVHEARLPALRDDYDAIRAAGIAVTELKFDRYGGLVATLPDGVTVLLGDDADLATKLPLVEPIVAQLAHKNRQVVAIDLRAPRAPVLVFKR